MGRTDSAGTRLPMVVEIGLGAGTGFASVSEDGGGSSGAGVSSVVECLPVVHG